MDGGQKSTLRKERVSGKKRGRAPLISGADLSRTSSEKKRKSDGREDKGRGEENSASTGEYGQLANPSLLACVKNGRPGSREKGGEEEESTTKQFFVKATGGQN
ncbi:hypothetical protein Q8A67_022033 [Cirrhinus molitorella]|uniref:Uncharacterized protein n=1 Tax=Cirrhinus molitorella TaxID=172907 RepID=A0AA88PBX4_9TELE|nr:hypothetical protein Q8A67_022033 [Cirrhinus molitorella]